MRRQLLWILAFSGGFIDTASFVAAGGIFAAHVTGNFVVFASQFALGKEGMAFEKLLTFPAFAFGVLFSGFMKNISLKNFIRVIAIFLMMASVLYFYSASEKETFYITLLVVFAMGMQNSLHRIFLKGLPTSTVMTGNTTQVFLEIFSKVKTEQLKIATEMILSFFIGCLTSAYLIPHVGLSGIIICPIALLIVSISDDLA